MTVSCQLPNCQLTWGTGWTSQIFVEEKLRQGTHTYIHIHPTGVSPRVEYLTLGTQIPGEWKSAVPWLCSSMSYNTLQNQDSCQMAAHTQPAMQQEKAATPWHSDRSSLALTNSAPPKACSEFLWSAEMEEGILEDNARYCNPERHSLQSL